MNLLYRLTRPLRWRTPRATARQLLSFARAERASFYDLMEAANESKDATRRALYLVHATDEARHAQMFSRRAFELCAELAADPQQHTADFEHLFTGLGEVPFLAFVHRGECRGLTRLRRFRDEHAQRGDTKTRALLDTILRDEERHAAYTADLLQTLTDGQPRRALARARRWEWGRSWLRTGNTLAQLLFALSMRVLYLMLFPLALVLRRRTPRKSEPWQPS